MQKHTGSHTQESHKSPNKSPKLEAVIYIQSTYKVGKTNKQTNMQTNKEDKTKNPP